MSNFKVAAWPIALACLVTAGCQNITDPESTIAGAGGGRVTLAGPNQLFDGVSFEKLDLLYELDPDGRYGTSPATGDAAQDAARRDLARAFQAFYSYPNPQERRNRVQDRILAASEQRCNLFRTYLQRYSSGSNFALGSLTTLLGGLGAIFTSASTARALAGAAGITSGVNAEMNQAYLSSLAVNVITKGIEARRTRVRQQILTTRNATAAEYTVEAAVLDGVRYHGACSITAGFEEAAQSIDRVSNPGLKTFYESAILVRRAQDAMAGVSEAARPGQALPLIDDPLYTPLVPSEPTPAERYPAALSTLDAAHRALVESLAQRRSELPAAAVTALDAKDIAAQSVATRNAARAALSTIFACDKTHDLTVEIVTARENLRRTAPGDRRTATIALLTAQQKAQIKMLDPLNQRLAEDVGLFADASKLLRAATVPAEFDAVVNELKKVKASPAAPCP